MIGRKIHLALTLTRGQTRTLKKEQSMTLYPFVKNIEEAERTSIITVMKIEIFFSFVSNFLGGKRRVVINIHLKKKKSTTSLRRKEK